MLRIRLGMKGRPYRPRPTRLAYRGGVESAGATAPTGGVISVHPLPTLRTQAVPSAETEVAVQVPAGDTKITTSAPDSASPMPAGFSLKLLARVLATSARGAHCAAIAGAASAHSAITLTAIVRPCLNPCVR